MYKDAYSLPSLSENIMSQFSILDFESTLNNTIPSLNDNIPKIYPTARIKDYITQDLNGGRSINNYITADEIIKLLEKYVFIYIYLYIYTDVFIVTLD